MKHPIPVLILCLGLLLLAVSAHAAVNLQTCSVTPTLGGVMGCPSASMTFTPVSSTSLVRSQVNSIQGWRPFNTLAASDEVYTADGTWHTLSSIQPALQPITPVPLPVIVPPPANLTQDVLITLVGGNAPQAVMFAGVPVPACFSIGPAPSKQVCLP
jgi:hypothetical protein